MCLDLRKASPLLPGALLGGAGASCAPPEGSAVQVPRRGSASGSRKEGLLRLLSLAEKDRQGTPMLAHFKGASPTSAGVNFLVRPHRAEPYRGGHIWNSLACWDLYFLPEAFCVSSLFLLICRFVFVPAFSNSPGPSTAFCLPVRPEPNTRRRGGGLAGVNLNSHEPEKF